MCVYCVYLFCIYKDTHTVYILKIFTCLYLYSYNLYYIKIYLIYKYNIFFLNVYNIHYQFFWYYNDAMPSLVAFTTDFSFQFFIWTKLYRKIVNNFNIGHWSAISLKIKLKKIYKKYIDFSDRILRLVHLDTWFNNLSQFMTVIWGHCIWPCSSHAMPEAVELY